MVALLQGAGAEANFFAARGDSGDMAPLSKDKRAKRNKERRAAAEQKRLLGGAVPPEVMEKIGAMLIHFDEVATLAVGQ